MRRAIVIALISILSLSSRAALSGKKPEKRPLPESELAQAPAAADSWRNPYEGHEDALLAGKKLYDRHCAQCHRPDGRGKGKAPNLHSPEIQNVSPGRLFWFLKNGNLKEGMPSWSRLPDAQRWQLVTYLKSLK